MSEADLILKRLLDFAEDYLTDPDQFVSEIDNMALDVAQDILDLDKYIKKGQVPSAWIRRKS